MQRVLQGFAQIANSVAVASGHSILHCISRAGSIVPGLHESLQQILGVEGARTVALVDVGTGMVVGSAGDQPAGFPVAAAGLADEARLADGALGAGRPGGDLDELLLITKSSFHLVKILNRWQDEGLLLFVDLDRSRTNVALATLQVAQAASAVLA